MQQLENYEITVIKLRQDNCKLTQEKQLTEEVN